MDREQTSAERDTPSGRLQEWIQVTDVDGVGITVARILSWTGEDRVDTTVQHFRVAATNHAGPARGRA